MSLSVVGVWAVGVWDETVWAEGVWQEGGVVVARTKGGAGDAAISSKEKRLRRDIALAKRKAARLAALDDAQELFESIFGEDDEIAGIHITDLPQPPEIEIDISKEIVTIKNRLIRRLAEAVRKKEIEEFNKKVKEFKIQMRRLEEELVAVLVLTEDENVGTIHLGDI